MNSDTFVLAIRHHFVRTPRSLSENSPLADVSPC